MAAYTHLCTCTKEELGRFLMTHFSLPKQVHNAIWHWFNDRCTTLSTDRRQSRWMSRSTLQNGPILLNQRIFNVLFVGFLQLLGTLLPSPICLYWYHRLLILNTFLLHCPQVLSSLPVCISLTWTLYFPLSVSRPLWFPLSPLCLSPLLPLSLFYDSLSLALSVSLSLSFLSQPLWVCTDVEWTLVWYRNKLTINISSFTAVFTSYVWLFTISSKK